MGPSFICIYMRVLIATSGRLDDGTRERANGEHARKTDDGIWSGQLKLHKVHKRKKKNRLS